MATKKKDTEPETPEPPAQGAGAFGHYALNAETTNADEPAKEEPDHG